MRIRRLFFYFFGFALIGFLLAPVGVQAVQAFQVTMTGTATFIPPSATPASGNFTCPQGTPAGWGTYTPSPLWSVQCGNCSAITTPTPTLTYPTGTASPIPTWNGTGTPYTFTPSPSPTVTVLPTVTPPTSQQITCASGHTGWTCAGVDYNTILYTCTNSNGTYCDNDTLPYSANSSLFPNVQIMFVTGNLHTGGGVNMSYWSYRSGSPAPTAFYIWDSVNLANYLYLPGSYWTSGGANYYWGGNAVGAVYYHTLINTGQIDYSGGQQTASGARVGINTKFYISVDPAAFTPTPTPTVTGTPLTPTITPTPFMDTGYCSTVAPPSSDFGFNLFIPIGEPNCDMGWNEFTVGTYVVPAAQICVQPSEFGVITLFGQPYEIGIFALAAAAAFFWRFFRTV